MLELIKDSPDPYVWELADKIDVAVEKVEELIAERAKCKKLS